MAKNLAKKNYPKVTDDQENKLKRHSEKSKFTVASPGKDRSDVNSGSTLLTKNKISSVSHTSNANESTLPLSNQWDSAVREQKVEKEFRSNSDTGRNLCYIDEELKSLNAKTFKMKTEFYRPSSNTHKEGNNVNEVKNSIHLSEKLLAYLRLQNHPSQQQSTLTAYNSPILKRKVSIGDKTGLKAYKADIQFPLSAKNSRSNKQSNTVYSSQASSTKNSARGKDAKKPQEHTENFSGRNFDTGNQSNSANLQKILSRKLSDQSNQINKHDLQMFTKQENLTSPSNRNTDRTAKNRLSNPPEIYEINQSNKIQDSKKMTKSEIKQGNSAIYEAGLTSTQDGEDVNSPKGLVGLIGRLDSILLRYEREELRLRRKNTELLHLLDEKIAEINSSKKSKQIKEHKEHK